MALWAAASPLAAQDRGVYDIFLGNVPVGIFAYSGVEGQGRYSLAGQLRTTGLIGALTSVRYTAKTQGRIRSGRFVPQSYEELANIGDRNTALSITYDNGVPNPPVFTPPRVSDRPSVDPSQQGDALDLLTALYALFRDTPGDRLCRFGSFIYDGARRTSISLRPLRQSAEEVVCAAEYRRISGFTVAELRRRETFDFRLVYAPNGDGTWSVARADVESVYGVVSLERRAAP
ncbi:MAG: DUF3108 domain-containing protein [Pseudomonadota bacterium]